MTICMLWFWVIFFGFCICSCTSEPVEEKVKSGEQTQSDSSSQDSGLIETHKHGRSEAVFLSAVKRIDEIEEKNALQKKFYQDGQLKEEALYGGGMKNGPFRSWFSNGQIKVRGTMENDRWNGSYEEWYEDGTPRIVGQYIKGRQHGEWCFFDNKGIPMPSLRYDEGREVTRELPNLLP
jgi:antitoxin component YwqK of YwqJK toxin-antitoxin module